MTPEQALEYLKKGFRMKLRAVGSEPRTATDVDLAHDWYDAVDALVERGWSSQQIVGTLIAGSMDLDAEPNPPPTGGFDLDDNRSKIALLYERYDWEDRA